MLTLRRTVAENLVFADFENSLDGFSLGCGGIPASSYITGHKGIGKGLKLWSTGGDGVACATKTLAGGVIAGDTYYIWAKGYVIWQLYASGGVGHISGTYTRVSTGQTTTSIQMHNAFNNGQPFDDWELFKFISTQTETVQNVVFYVYNNFAAGEIYAGYYDRITKTKCDAFDQLLWESLQKIEGLTKEIDTLEYLIKQSGAKDIPALGDNVELYEDGVKIYGGVITERSDYIEGGVLKGYNIRAKDYTQLLDRKLVTKSYINQTARNIILDIISAFTIGFTTNNVAAYTPNLGSVKFNYEPVSKAIQKIADLIGYDWYVDYDKDIHFFGGDVNPAPFDITDNNGKLEFATLRFDRNILELKNNVFVRGGQYQSTISEANAVDKYAADGEQRVFSNIYRYSNINVKVAGAAKTIGIDNITDPDTVDCLYNFQEKAIKFRDNNKPANGTVVTIYGDAYIPLIAQARDQISIAAYGEYQHIIIDKTISSVSEAQTRAKAELVKWSEGSYEGSFITLEKGLETGQQILINSAIFGINKKFKVNRIIGKARGYDHMEYEVYFIASGELTFFDIMAGLLGRDRQNIEISDDEVLQRLELFDENIAISEVVNTIKKLPPYTWGPGGSNDGKWGFSTWSEEIGLVGRWNFEELLNNGAVAKDVSGKGNNGNLINLEIPDDWAEGARAGSKALQFDGVNEYVNAPNFPSLNILTVSGWFKTPSSIINDKNIFEAGGQYQSFRLMARWDGSGNGVVWIHISTDGGISGEHSIVVGCTLLIDTWYHIAGSYDGTTYRIYLNGVLVKSEDYNQFYNILSFFRIGGNDYGGYSQGRVTGVRIYDRVLSLPEIAFLFNNKI